MPDKEDISPDIDRTMRDMSLRDQEVARRKSIILQRAREGYTIGEQCKLAGIVRNTHAEYRKEDGTFYLDWQKATQEAEVRDLERTKMARGRRRLRAEMGSVGVQ